MKSGKPKEIHVNQVSKLEIKIVQVHLYSFLLSERFSNSDDTNILLYLSQSSNHMQIIKTVRSEISKLIRTRNTLAKLLKPSSSGISMLSPIFHNYNQQKEHCFNCNEVKICSLYNLTFEAKLFKDPFFSQYQLVKDSLDELTIEYFKKWYSIIELESSTTNF